MSSRTLVGITPKRPRYYHGIGVFFCPECIDRNLHCHLFYPVKYLRVRDASDLQPSAVSPRLDSESSVLMDISAWLSTCYLTQTWVVYRVCIRVSIQTTNDGSSRPPPTSHGVPTITTTPNRLSITEIKKKSFRPFFQPLAPRVPKMYIVTQWGLLCCWCYLRYRDV